MSNELGAPVAGVPPGPGVQPPFAAAPTEGRTARRWWGVGIAAALVAVCCGVSGLALGGLAFTMLPALNEQAQAAVGDYLDALIERDWEGAHELRCPADREAESLAEFTDRVSEPPRLESYELGELDLLGSEDGQLRLPADLFYDDGSSEQEEYPLAQDPATGTLQVCQRVP